MDIQAVVIVDKDCGHAKNSAVKHGRIHKNNKIIAL